MEVTLSGGPIGGQVVTWEEGLAVMVVDGCIYVLASGGQAVFAGMQEDLA